MFEYFSIKRGTCQNLDQNVYGFPLYDTILGVIFRPVTNRPHQVGHQADILTDLSKYGHTVQELVLDQV